MVSSSSLKSSLDDQIQDESDSSSATDADFVDCNWSSKSDMIEEAFSLMVDGRKVADSILAQCTYGIDSTPAFYDVEGPLNASRLLSQLPPLPRVAFTDSDLNFTTSSIHAKIDSFFDVSDCRACIIKPLLPTSCLIPFTLLHEDRHSVFTSTTKGMNTDEICRSLGKKELVIALNFLESNEALDSGFELDDDDDHSIFSDLVETLQRGDTITNTPNTLDFEIGKIEYQKLIKRSTQLLSSCDFAVPLSEIDLLSPTIVLAAAVWNLLVEGEILQRILERTFCATKNDSSMQGAHGDSSIMVKLLHSGQSKVRCHIGSRHWRSDYYGLGVAFEVQTDATLMWNRKNDQENPGDLNSPLMTYNCVVVQGFPVATINMLATGDSKTLADLIDLEQGYVILHESTVNRECSVQKIDGSKPRVVEAEIDAGLMAENSKSSNGEPSILLSSVVQNIEAIESFHDFDDENMQTGFDVELYTWGDNTLGTLGYPYGVDDQTKFSQVAHSKLRRVEIAWLCPMEKIKAVACAQYHTLILSSFGSVFTCGDGSDGQLGHGSLQTHQSFRRIESFIGSDATTDPICVDHISAGGDTFGSHSAAVDKNGILYTWGNAKLCGHPYANNSKRGSHSVMCPQSVGIFHKKKVLKVSCGGSFTVALVLESDTSGPLVYSWGLITRGRLGHGKPLMAPDQKKHAKKSKKSAMIYQISPTSISTLHDIKDICAGASHAVAAGRKGEVYAWGNNDHGQCAIVSATHQEVTETMVDEISESSNTNMWDDVWKPRGVPGFGKFTRFEFSDPTNCGSTKQIVFADKVVAGQANSAVIDSHGDLWTWGGESYSSSSNTKGIFRSATLGKPSMMLALLGKKLNNVQLGLSVNAAVSDIGTLFLWGMGLDDTVGGKTDHDNKHQRGSILQSLVTNIQVPRRPVSTWLEPINGRKIKGAACVGESILILAGGKEVGLSLKYLTRRSVGHRCFSRGEAFEYDCELIAAGRRIPCHKIILCHRCPSMRELVLLEEPQQQGPDGSLGRSKLTEIFLPDLRFDVAEQLIHYIYTDEITNKCAMCLLELYLAASAFKLPRLMALCNKERQIWNISISNDDIQQSTAITMTESTLLHDMMSALQDRSWSDVRFMASGKEIFAHGCILSARSPYFRRLLNSMQHDKSNQITTVVFPDSPNALLKLLLYIYSGTLASVTTDELLEDLLIANRYEQWRMVEECESEILVVPQNALRVLQVAISADAPRLKEVAIRVTCQNLGESLSTAVNGERADLLTFLNNDTIREIFDRILSNNIHSKIPKDRLDRRYEAKQRARQRRLTRQETTAALIFGPLHVGDSVKKLLMLVFLVICYTCIQNLVILGPAVPIINTAFLIYFLFYFVKKM